MSRQVDHPALMEFVHKRRKATGGYGATPRLPATIQDTFQAVAIGLVLGQETSTPQSEPALVEYLARMLAVPWLGIDTTFRLLITCRVCGLATDAARVRSHLAACLARDASLAATYYVSRIAREILGENPSFRGAGRSLMLPASCAVGDVARYLFLKKMDDQPVAGAGELVAWLQRSQNGDGGFGFFPGTTSFIENCHAGLAALSLLGARPIDPANVRSFIISCQTGGGGFARSPGAAPFLDASWHGIASLCLLEEMEQHPAGVLSEIASQRSRLILSV
ncbi:MAG: prenyltransferase/squalene oxidase repeat-containing protein [Nitrospirota bacterium]|nr:prenyltransferase/squalene oxidase repeat-containing protein [Nitrospirota bacterium]